MKIEGMKSRRYFRLKKEDKCGNKAKKCTGDKGFRNYVRVTGKGRIKMSVLGWGTQE